MIMARMAGYRPKLAMIMAPDPEAVSDAETNTAQCGTVWHTEPVTSGRTIIAWRVGS